MGSSACHYHSSTCVWTSAWALISSPTPPHNLENHLPAINFCPYWLTPRMTEGEHGLWDCCVPKDCCLIAVYIARMGCEYFVYFWLRSSLVEEDVFPMAASSGRLALHGHVSATKAPFDSREGEGEGDVAFSIWSLPALVRQSDVKALPPTLQRLTSPLSFLLFCLTLLCVGPLVLPPAVCAGPHLSVLTKSVHTEPFIVKQVKYKTQMWFIRHPFSQHRQH